MASMLLNDINGMRRAKENAHPVVHGDKLVVDIYSQLVAVHQQPASGSNLLSETTALAAVAGHDSGHRLA